MSYRIQIELDEHAPLEEKVLLHAKFLRHYQRRHAADSERPGRTNWGMQFNSARTMFTILWSRQPRVPGRACRYNMERLIGWVVIKFSADDMRVGGPFLVMGDWAAIEAKQRERVA